MSAVRLWKDLGRWTKTAGDIALSSPMQLFSSLPMMVKGWKTGRHSCLKATAQENLAGRKCLQIIGGEEETKILVIIMWLI